MKKITIGKFTIGEKNPCFIIAEAGVNHNGDIALAKKLVDVAREAGADAVKFQTFTTENIVTKDADMAEYQKKNVKVKESQFAMLKKLELSHKDFIELKKYCDKKGIMFLSTPHTDDAVDFLAPLVPAYKIASGDLTNIPLLEKIAKTKKPIILSTGMGTIAEIKEAISAIRKQGNTDIIILHCTSNYPCPLEDVNMRAMQTLQKTFPYPIGYSDHTQGVLIPVMAVALGAVVIEKHFTLDKTMPGPDHIASLSPKELKEVIENIRNCERALGSGRKIPSAAEKRIALVARKSIVAGEDIKKGQRITQAMLAIKRPDNGIKPKFLSRVIGKKAIKNISRDTLIKFNDIQ